MVTLRSCQTRVGILGLTPKGASTAACSLPSAPFGAACWAAVGEAGGVRVLEEHTEGARGAHKTAAGVAGLAPARWRCVVRSAREASSLEQVVACFNTATLCHL